MFFFVYETSFPTFRGWRFMDICKTKQKGTFLDIRVCILMCVFLCGWLMFCLWVWVCGCVCVCVCVCVCLCVAPYQIFTTTSYLCWVWNGMIETNKDWWPSMCILQTNIWPCWNSTLNGWWPRISNPQKNCWSLSYNECIEPGPIPNLREHWHFS